MKLINNWYLPDNDEHFAKIPNLFYYQIDKKKISIKLCKNKRVAIDIGAHIGTWAIYLAGFFEKVYAFEIDSENYNCLIKNISVQKKFNIEAFNIALGEYNGCCGFNLNSDKNSGAGQITFYGQHPIKTLDSFQLSDVDYIKIDTQGSEHQILKGATFLLKRNSPVIICEQDLNKLALPFLKKNDYKENRKIGSDYIFIR